MDIFYILLIFVCLFGLCMGSFFNVVILRSLSNESIVMPPSKCPKCGKKLYFWHNIPVLSYILLGGKCYFCKESISIQYPIIEILTMLLYVLAYYTYPTSTNVFFLMFFFSCYLIMTVTDIKAKLVDCNIAIMLAIGGFLFHAVNFGWSGVGDSILGLIIGAVILEIIARLGYFFINDRAMGEADTYVAGALGAVFGAHAIIPVLIYGLFASMFFIVPQFLYKQYRNKNFRVVNLALIFLFFVILCEHINSLWLLIPLFVFGIMFAVNILKSLKNVSERSYLPYVPALIIGAILFMYME